MDQSGFPYQASDNSMTVTTRDLEYFAELIVKECAKVAWYHTPDTEELEYSHLIEDKILEHFGVK
jgi:hypothetical protein